MLMKPGHGACPNLLLSALLFLFASMAVFATFNASGIYWDFIAHIFYAKSLLSPVFYSSLLHGDLFTAINNANSFYFEPERAPLVGLLLIPFVLSNNNFIQLYLAFILLLNFFSVWFVSKKIKLNFFLLSLLFFTPFAFLYFVLLNGTELVSMTLALFGFGLLLDNKWQSGFLFALSSLAKYPSLVFVPLLLLLPHGRKKAFAAFLITLFPWLMFNFFAFGNPAFSYLYSLGIFSHSGSALAGAVVSLRLLFETFDLAIAVLACLLILRLAHKNLSIQTTSKKGEQTFGNSIFKKTSAFLALGLFGWLLTLPNGSVDNLPRLVYLIYPGFALLIGLLISAFAQGISVKVSRFRARLLPLVLAVLFIFSLGSVFSAYRSNAAVFSSYGYRDPIYASVKSALATLGLENCNFVSNDWVYLRYIGIRAHSPFYYNSTIQRYPIIAFNSLGVNKSSINFSNVSVSLNFSGFSVDFPRNYTCK